MGKPEISIIIVNYNVKDLLLQCLKSIYSKYNISLPIETIVVDNNSSDNSVEAVRKEFPQVRIILNKLNAGFPAANNQGFEQAEGKYIFMLNPDTELIEDALFLLYNYLQNNTDVKLVAPMLLNTDGSRQLSVWRFPTLKDVFFETNYLRAFLGKKNYADKDYSKLFEAESVSGAAILFNKDILDKIGMLDETMFWIEDVELCYRARKAGVKLIYYPQAKVKHHIGQSAKKNYNISISNQVVNKIKFFKKHHNTFEWLMVILISLYHVVLKIIVFGALASFNKTYFKKAKAYIYTLPLVFNPPQGMR